MREDEGVSEVVMRREEELVTELGNREDEVGSRTQF